MAFTSFALRYNTNSVLPSPVAGDLAIAIYDITIDGNAESYPAGGEPIDFSNEFVEVHSVAGPPMFVPAGAAQPTTGALLPGFERAAGNPGLNTGFLRFFVTGNGAGAVLDELAAAAYPGALVFQLALTVFGRPITASQ